ARAAVCHLARHPRLQHAEEPPLTERPALMRAAVAQREELPAHIEDADRPPRHRDDLPPTRRDLIHPPHHMPPHSGLLNREGAKDAKTGGEKENLLFSPSRPSRLRGSIPRYPSRSP